MDDLEQLCEPVIEECCENTPRWLRIIFFLWLFG